MLDPSFMLILAVLSLGLVCMGGIFDDDASLALGGGLGVFVLGASLLGLVG